MFKHILVILKLTEKSLMLIKTTPSIPVVGTVSYRKQHIIKLLLICSKIQNLEPTVVKLPVHYLKVKTLPII
ncbi:Glycosyl-phosphatidylinositol-anchored aspartic endopeptidase [Candida albicans P75010]|nr:Glycosyl-phosphatidylinositol-anchored aspartic endopeptidase [Candida albicans P75010]